MESRRWQNTNCIYRLSVESRQQIVLMAFAACLRRRLLLRETSASAGVILFSKEVDLLITRKEKERWIEDLADDLRQANLIIATDYRGLDVAGINTLRKTLRAEQCRYQVTKNTLTRLACRRAGLESLEIYLTGPTALAFTSADPVAAARLLLRFSGDNKTFAIKGGLLEGLVLEPDKIKELGQIPSREILYARLCGGLQAPIYGFASVLRGNISKLVYALEAVRQKKESA